MPRPREGLRGHVKQLRHYLHPYREDPRTLVYDAAALRGLRVPAFRLRRRVPGSVWACSLVRDEVDIIDRTLDHLLRQGIHHVLVADNGSTDGTLERLRERSVADPRIHVVVDREGTFYQGAKMTRLAQVAALAGADWVVPFDADELWFAVGTSVADFLAGSSSNQMTAQVFNAVPRKGFQADVMSRFLLGTRPTGWSKVAFRAHPFARVEFGSHVIHRVGPSDTGLYVAHLAYRSPEHLRRKLIQGGAAMARTGMGEHIGYQWRWGSRLPKSALDEVWDNVSTGRPEPRIDWPGLRDPQEADLDRWTQWEGPHLHADSAV